MPKIAIYYDWLNQWGGAERLLLDLLEIYPDAHLFTSVYNPTNTPWIPSNIIIHSSRLNNFTIFKKNSIFSALAQPLALEKLDFTNFDIVISITSQNGICLLTSPKTLFICYCLTPNRYLYQHKYPKIISKLVNIYQKINYIYSQRPNNYIAISNTVKHRINKNYHRQSVVIYPGVNTAIFKPPSNPLTTHQNSPYFLIVSRLVPHKKIDQAIFACIKTGHNLNIVGSGRCEKYLKSLANNHSNIKFLGSLSQPNLIEQYQNCTALLCPQLEDFGYTSLEAQACGKPVIAYQKGGIQETVVHQITGILYQKQTVSSLIRAIKKFPTININPADCIQNASKFSRPHFMLNFKSTVDNLWQNHQKNLTT